MTLIPDGTTVYKINSDETDGHSDGAEAIVLSHVGPIGWGDIPHVYGYMVQWTDMPAGTPVFVVGTRLTTERRPEWPAKSTSR